MLGVQSRGEAEVAIPTQWKVWRFGALPAGGMYQAVVNVMDIKTYPNVLVNLPHRETAALRMQQIHFRDSSDFKDL